MKLMPISKEHFATAKFDIISIGSTVVYVSFANTHKRIYRGEIIRLIKVKLNMADLIDENALEPC